MIANIRINLTLYSRTSGQLHQNHNQQSSIGCLANNNLLFQNNRSSFSSLFIAAMACGDKSTFQMDVISFHRLPKLVILLTILESCTLQFLDKHLFLKMHIVTQFIKRRIIIT